MTRVFKVIGMLLASLLGLALLAVAALLVYGNIKFKPRHADYPLYPIVADTSPEGLARGKYLMENVMSCDKACHSEGDAPFIGMADAINEGPVSGVFAVPNITTDEETGIGAWSDAEIARAIREGVDDEGVELLIMPFSQYRVLSDADTAAIVGYLRQLEPVRNEVPPLSLNAVGKAMLVLGIFGPSQLVTPITSAQNAPEPGTVDYGGYLVALGACRDCHGPNLAGGASEGGEGMATPNLTPAGELASWSEQDFLKAMRNGVTPNGEIIDPQGMPWPSYGQMVDEDLLAIFHYLQSLPPTQPAS